VSELRAEVPQATVSEGLAQGPLRVIAMELLHIGYCCLVIGA